MPQMLRNIFRLWMCWPVCWPCHYFFQTQCESATQFIFPRLLELCIKAGFGSTVHFLSSCFPKQEAIEKKYSNFSCRHSSDDNYDSPGLIKESSSSFSQCQHETLSKNEFCLSLGR